MKTTNKKTGLGYALALGLALAVPVANAQIMSASESPEDVNIIGLGMGGVPDYMGSKASKRGVVPIARYQFYGTQSYFMLLGSQASYTWANDEHWRFGPLVNFRSGRGSSVDDAVVKRMVGINGTAETGVFLAYSTKLGKDQDQQIKVSGDVAGSRNGTVGNLRMTYTLQLNQTNAINVSVGTTIANDRWMEKYFGITNASDIALYPSLAGRPFNAGGGVKGNNVSLSLTQALGKSWLLLIGFRYEKLVNDAKYSPITAQSGSSNQWTNSMVLSYLF